MKIYGNFKNIQSIPVKPDYFSQELRQVQRNIQLLRNQLDKVNTLLHMEENTQWQLEQGNKLQEVEFIAELKELEYKILMQQERLEQINHEKDRFSITIEYTEICFFRQFFKNYKIINCKTIKSHTYKTNLLKLKDLFYYGSEKRN